MSASTLQAAQDTTNGEVDEFGDDSFLRAIDVEALTTPNKPAKRAKISPETDKHTTSSTVTATVTNQANGKLPMLEQSLAKWFGYDSFRHEQRNVMEHILAGEDVAVFWATGAGKSICYQLPALHTGKVALVVSPLISLMQDQVHKLNGSTSGRKLATFLGSAQTDPQEEARALRGEYPLVYVTPEKLLSAGFLDSASQLDLALVAIDESHCVSSWGHDFRPEYRQAGQALRAHPALKKVPIMALTATAVPRIQKDIVTSLRMREQSMYISKQSFDRSNLHIQVLLKSASATQAAMEPLVRSLVKRPTSTIVYTATKAQAEELGSYLQQRLQAEGSAVQAAIYHGSCNLSDRAATHEGFLTGRISVVVATSAFGMGIDKPDIRKVVHFGPPQTVEDYYQQMGRAGRDGSVSECLLYYSPGDFNKYSSDFYTKGQSLEAQQMTKQSTQALKQYCMDSTTCRRKTLLGFFGETPAFGDRCGTCDACRNQQDYQGDTTRDFTDVAKLLLEAVDGMKEPSQTSLMSVLGGKLVEPWRYRHGTMPEYLKQKLQGHQSKISKPYTVEVLKGFLICLVQEGYLAEMTKQAMTNGYNRSFSGFSLTQKGKKVLLQDTSMRVRLPVPESIREAERKQNAHREKVLAQLKEQGVRMEDVPQEELDTGDGVVIRSVTKWCHYVELQKRQERHERASQLEELLTNIQTWRTETAAFLRMAPASVLAEHIMYSVAYANATKPQGVDLDKESLQAVGVRSRAVESLVTVLSSWASKYERKVESQSDGGTSEVMRFEDGPVIPAKKWQFAVYKPNKKTGKAAWESSWERFSKGESAQTIAMTPSKGRPIQVAMVVSHILDGFVLGRPVDLQKVSQYSKPPSREEWKLLEEAEAETSMNVIGDPTSSGVEGGSFRLKDLLNPIMGPEFATKSYDERSDEEKEKFSKWCQLLKWYMLMQRTGTVPKFD